MHLHPCLCRDLELKLFLDLCPHRMLHRCTVDNQRWTSATPRSVVPLRRRPPPAQGSTGHHPSMLPLIDHYLAVDDDVLDADRKLLGLGARRRGFDPLRIEHDDIGLEAIA